MMIKIVINYDPACWFGSYVGGRCSVYKKLNSGEHKDFVEAEAYCSKSYGGTNVIVDSQEITDKEAAYRVNEHWIRAQLVRDIKIFQAGW